MGGLRAAFMTRFAATIQSEDVVAAPRDEIWAVLTDPQRLARLVPRIDHIEVDGDRWRWYLTGLSVLGIRIQPSFTERMKLEPEERIRYWHDPGERRETAGTEGEYRLRDAEEGTHLWIRNTIHVDLPLPLMAKGAVRAIMLREMQRTGENFATALQRELTTTRTS